jgi:hypothetical protein
MRLQLGYPDVANHHTSGLVAGSAVAPTPATSGDDGSNEREREAQPEYERQRKWTPNGRPKPRRGRRRKGVRLGRRGGETGASAA